MGGLDGAPKYGKSSVVQGMSFIGQERVIGTGDMWPMTWADDGDIYAAAGDNGGFLDHFQTMNFWRIQGTPPDHEISLVNDFAFLVADGMDPESAIPPIKPAGVVSVDGILYLAVEDMRYTQGRYGNQINLHSWIITSRDHGVTWSQPPQPGSPEREFLAGVFASPHFLQFGRDYQGAFGDWVYAYSSAGDDGVAAWSAGDSTYLARVPRDKILDRSAWEFYATDSTSDPVWSRAMEKAAPVFSYQKKTGENEVVYHRGLERYLLLNWAFVDCANHMFGSLHSELSIFESENPWGPWSTVHVRRDWGNNCDYQPRLPTKWIDPKNNNAWLVSAGNFLKKGGRQHYAFVAAPIEFNTGDFGDSLSGDQRVRTLGDFKAEPLSESEIGLSWLPIQGAGFYRIIRDGVKRKDIPQQYPSEFVEKGLSPNERHDYRVLALSPAGDLMAASDSVSQTTLPKTDGRSLGLNFASWGFAEGATVWCAEKSETRFNVATAWPYLDDRILILSLIPEPGSMEPALRSFRGGIPGVKVVFHDLPARHLHLWVYVVDPHLSHTSVSFELWLQGILVDRYKSTENAATNWSIIGPYDVSVDEKERLLVEGKHFVGLGGIAAIKIAAV